MFKVQDAFYSKFDAAQLVASEVFNTTGIVLAIEEIAVEQCPSCGHTELSDGYGGNDCPDCSGVQMNLL